MAWKSESPDYAPTPVPRSDGRVFTPTAHVAVGAPALTATSRDKEHCPACGHSVNGGDNFCSSCGHGLAAARAARAKAIHSCGAALVAGDKFCFKCGANTH